jgi:hypothetical protein
MINSRVMIWPRHAVHMTEKTAYKILVENPEGKSTFGRQRRRYKDNPKIKTVN